MESTSAPRRSGRLSAATNLGSSSPDMAGSTLVDMQPDAVPGTNEVHPNVAAYGYLYSLHSAAGRRLRAFPMADNASDDRSPTIDQIDVLSLFKPKANLAVELLHARVTVEGANILIIGYYEPTMAINQTLLKVKPSTPWRGELAAFQIGTRVPVLSRPTARKRTFEQAIQLYLSRVTEAVDAGYPPPEIIISPFFANFLIGGVF